MNERIVDVSRVTRFQFTHPGKGATDERRSIERLGTSFNSRTLGRVRRRRSPLLTTPHDVSIHAPWEGCDQAYLRTAPYYREFHFTHPGRGATLHAQRADGIAACFNSRTPGGVRRDEIHSLEFITHVSIHAPREGCDRPCAGRSKRITSFNSRTPGGVRHVVRPKLLISLRFQFTHPGRGATRSQLILLNVKRCFNSRTPGGVRPNQTIDNFQLSRFQFTHPGRGATCLASFVSSTQESFNSRTPGGVRRASGHYHS